MLHERSNQQDFIPSNHEDVVFGFIPKEIISQLDTKVSWRTRTTAAEKVSFLQLLL